MDKMANASVLKVYCAHYHRNAEGWYRNIKVVTTAAIGTSIKTKPVPAEIRDTLEEINFKISKAGFAKVETEATSSGLQVCSVTKDGINDKFFTVADISKEIGKNNYSDCEIIIDQK